MEDLDKLTIDSIIACCNSIEAHLDSITLEVREKLEQLYSEILSIQQTIVLGETTSD